MHTVFLSLGTNLGNKEQNLLNAIEQISKRIGPVMAQSSFICTEPWGFESENKFLNAAVKVETGLSPEQLLEETQTIEQTLGRTKDSKRTVCEHSANTPTSGDGGPYSDRIIDIDILLYDDLHISTPKLTIPHPLMNERDFVLIPLSEIK